MSIDNEWTCSNCGKTHTGLVEGYGFEAPWTYYTVSSEERERRCSLSEDYCVIDDRDYFVRGCLEIPIIGEQEPFIWGVWASLSRENFHRERRLAQDPKRVEEPPYFGWLTTRIRIYPDTSSLKTHVHSRQVGMRPFIELQPTDHPLAIEQRTGITLERVREIGELMEHGWEHPNWNPRGS